MDLKRANYLPKYDPLTQGNPQAGYIRRPMSPEDSTDMGITQRIFEAAKAGLIHPQFAQYLIENLGSDQDSYDAINNDEEAARGIPAAPVQPNPMDVVPKGLLSR